MNNMKEELLQTEISEISPYSQINKAFRHVYGEKAAAVIATLVYKYTYWSNKKYLKPFKTKEGGHTFYGFYISKLDISIDSGVTISMLEKKDNSNPLVLLEELKVIKRMHSSKSNKADTIVIFKENLKIIVKQAAEIFDKEMELLNNLSRTKQRNFLKALNSKLSREEVYEKFEADNEIKIDVMDTLFNRSPDNKNANSPKEKLVSPKEKIASSKEKIVSSNGGVTKNKKKTKKSSEKRKQTDQIKTDNEITDGFNFSILQKALQDYTWRNIIEEDVHYILKNLIPNGKASHWQMSQDDRSYIKINLHSVNPGNIVAALDYIKSSIEKISSGKKDMRFGSILGGLYEKVINAQVGFDSSAGVILSEKEMTKVYNMIPETVDLPILQDL